MIELDGSVGIGGGQVLRTSLAFSAVNGVPVELRNIRLDRDPPGLSAQHLAAVYAVADVCNAEVEGANLRSTEVRFDPQSPPEAGTYEVDVAEFIKGGSAGSVTLIFQALLWPLVFADGDSVVTLSGGTHVTWSPSPEYLSDVYLPAVRELGVNATIELNQYGFYPAGKGKITAEVQGKGENWKPNAWKCEERGDLYTVDACSIVSNLPEHILHRQADQLNAIVTNKGIPVRMETRTPSSPGKGTAVYLHASYEHVNASFVSYGKRGKPAEEVARDVAEAFLYFHESGRPVQACLADQLMLPLCLAGGESRLIVDQVSGHLLTVKRVLEKLTDRRVLVEGSKGDTGLVEIG